MRPNRPFDALSSEKAKTGSQFGWWDRLQVWALISACAIFYDCPRSLAGRICAPADGLKLAKWGPGARATRARARLTQSGGASDLARPSARAHLLARVLVAPMGVRV